MTTASLMPKPWIRSAWTCDGCGDATCDPSVVVDWIGNDAAWACPACAVDNVEAGVIVALRAFIANTLAGAVGQVGQPWMRRRRARIVAIARRILDDVIDDVPIKAAVYAGDLDELATTIRAVGAAIADDSTGVTVDNLVRNTVWTGLRPCLNVVSTVPVLVADDADA